MDGGGDVEGGAGQGAESTFIGSFALELVAMDPVFMGPTAQKFRGTSPLSVPLATHNVRAKGTLNGCW